MTNPLLSALSSYRSQRGRKLVSEIAWLTNWDKPHDWKNRLTFQHYYQGAKDQAALLGFRLEPLWLRERGELKTGTILRNRGVIGILVAPLPPGQNHLDFDFSKFVAVHVGRSLHFPHLSSVAHNH